MTIGFVRSRAACLGVAYLLIARLLPPMFLVLGISVGMPMSAVSLFAGRTFARAQRLSPHVFSISVGAPEP